MSSLLGRDVKCVITTLQAKTKTIIIKSIPKGRMMASMLCLPRAYDMIWTRCYLICKLTIRPVLAGQSNEFSWQNFKHIYTNSAPAMIGVKSGFVILVKNEWPHVTSSHSSPHRYTPASKTPPLIFDGSYESYGQSNKFYSFEGKK